MNLYPNTILIILVLLRVNHAFNILAIVSLPLGSHYMAFKRLFNELAIRGHSITVLNNFPEENATENLKFIDLKSDNLNRRTVPPMSHFEKIDPRYNYLSYFFNHVKVSPSVAKADCENLLTNENVKTFLQNHITFDVIFVEQFRSDCGLAFAMAFFDAPIIGITSHTLLPWDYPRLGIPFDFGADAFYFSSSGPNPNFYHKVVSYVMNFVLNHFERRWVKQNIYEVFNKYYPSVSFDIDEATKRMKMMFVYQHHSITGSRLLAPNILEIAGVHIRPSKPVPQDIEDVLSNAEHGAIYVSFGSNLKVHTLSQSKIQEFLDAFKNIPQKVLWKLENVTLPAGYENVYTNKWFPQLDVLCHPKVIAFISHAGMLSMSESAHCGKPLVVIPFFGDQFSNAAAAVSTGLGIKLDFGHLNAHTLAAAIKRLATREMQENAQRISRLWHDRPQDVLESAIYWTEYVARHQTAPSPLPSSQSEWFQFTLIDVYCVLILLMLMFILTIYTMFRLLFSISKLFKSKIKRKRE